MFNKTRKLGGVRILSGHTISEAFNQFFSNSTFSVFSVDGSVGIIIKAQLKEDVNSPYKITRTNYFNMPVKQILIKFSYVNINTEVEIQQDLFMKTISDDESLLEPICPAILYAYNGKFNKERKTYVKNHILNNLENMDDIEKIESIFENRVYMFAMELMDGFVQLAKIEHSLPEYKYYKYMALYELRKMHRYGYLHNDIHDRNILVNPNYNYFESCEGRVILIDFGTATREEQNADLDEMMNNDVGRIDNSLLENIKNNKEHKNIQQNYLLKIKIELNLNKSVKDIINSFIFYKGGHMNNSKKLIKDSKNSIKKMDFSDLTYEDITKYMTDRYFEKMRDNNKNTYDLFMTSIESVKKEANPEKYFESMIEETMHYKSF